MKSEAVAPQAAPVPAVRIHLTNVVGLGAVQLLKSILSRMQAQAGYAVTDLYLPSSGELAMHTPLNHHTRVHKLRRFLPNAISRVLECTLFGSRFDGSSPLLVMGDIPLRCNARQTVFVQTPLLTGAAGTEQRAGALKYRIARFLFKWNSARVACFIVQTEAMKIALEQTYPALIGRVQIVGQPAPEWLLEAGLRRQEPTPNWCTGLSLFYPAASYPHKNHDLLTKIAATDAPSWRVRELVLTVPEAQHPNHAVSWINCVGRLSSTQVVDTYRQADALVFLSLSESLGFPLIEAMSIGLPVICPDLPYARVICGDQAIYFDPVDSEALQNAIAILYSRLEQGWWPDWSARMATIPASWDEVARKMLKLAAGHTESIQ